MTSNARKGRERENEVIKIFESRGWTLIMRATRYRKGRFGQGIVEFGPYDIVMGRVGGIITKNERLCIQVKSGELPSKTVREIQEWHIRFGLMGETPIFVVRRKRKTGIFYDVHNLDGKRTEEINWSELKKGLSAKPPPPALHLNQSERGTLGSWEGD